jgi:uncharacterized protein (DUF433 family)
MDADAALLRRITTDPDVMAGQPVIAGTRLSVEYILNRLAHGDTVETLVAEFQGVKVNDIRACLLYASRGLNATTPLPLPEEAA